jgi:hypothetical protein
MMARSAEIRRPRACHPAGLLVGTEKLPAEGHIMKRLFVLLLVIVVGIVGLGFYRGWFTVNPGKIQQDEQRAKEEVRELMQDVKAKTGERTDTAKERP